MKHALQLPDELILKFNQRPISLADFDSLRLRVIGELEVPQGSVRQPRIEGSTYDKIALLCENTNVILKISEYPLTTKPYRVPVAEIVSIYEESGQYFASDVLSLHGTQCPYATDAFDTWKVEIDQFKKYWWVIEEKMLTSVMEIVFPRLVTQ